jgi:hypothetical protein
MVGIVRWAGLAALAAVGLWLTLWISYPDLFGGSLLPPWLRAAAFLAVIAGCLVAAVGERRRGGRLAWYLAGGAHAVAVWWVTFEATLAIDARHHGRLAGNEGLLVAGVWSLYGLGLALAERRFSHMYVRHAARLMLGAGVVMLVGGAILSNARWADLGYRVFAYVAVLASAFVAEALFERYRDEPEVRGLVALVAAVGGVMALAFETRLWLDRNLFTFPTAMARSAAHYAWEASVRGYAAAVNWGLYAVGVAAAGRALRAPRARLTAAALAVVGLGYLLRGAVQYGPAAGMVPPVLALIGAVAAAGGAGMVAWLGRRAPGERHPYEAPVGRWLPWVAGAALVVSVGLLFV